MKIKCVSNIASSGYVADYLTPGKVYDMTPYDEENDAGELIDDTGDIIFEYLQDPGHAQWEKVE